MATIDEEAARGAQAEALMRNEIYIETFEILEQSYIEAWKNTQPHQVDDRERIFRLQLTLNEVKEHIENVALTGKMAMTAIEDSLS